jgi:hypothetical protein
MCGLPKQERIVNSISDVGADGKVLVSGFGKWGWRGAKPGVF